MNRENYNAETLASEMLREIGTDSFNMIAQVSRLIAWGRPVAVQEVAESLHLKPEEAKRFLKRFGGEFDEAGGLVGLGLTMVPTNHSFQVDGHGLYTWCAGDTLIFPMILGKNAKVMSKDPVSGDGVVLTTTPQGVEAVEPKTTVLSWPAHPNGDDVRRAFCDVTHFFTSAETAEQYASKTKGVIVLRPDEVRDIFRIIAGKTKIIPQ